MKPVQPIYLRGGGCRVLLCGYNIYVGVRLSRFSTCSGSIYGIFLRGFSPKYFSMTRHRHFLESTRL